MTLLGDRLLAVHDALDAARLPHAFGGAIAYAYCAHEPRATRDIDVNVFVSPEHVDRVVSAMPGEVTATEAAIRMAKQNGQTRLHWADTPVDVFLAVHDFHREAAGAIRTVPFEGRSIPVLSCGALVVFKVLFNRTRDWADIEEMVAAKSFDPVEARITLEHLLGPDDEAVRRLAGLTDARS